MNILGFSSLIFIGLSLFFPYWNWSNSSHHFISLWQMTDDGNMLYHWDILWNWQQYGLVILISIHQLAFLITFILLLARYLLKRTFPGIEFFLFSIPLAVVCAFIFPATIGFSYSGPLTPLYGPTWGLAFGWWSVLIAGILGMARKYYSNMVKRKKTESEEL